jgi:peptidoglycan/xylan/chitin deacetylase (PgdA/CDA1 family)
MDNPYYGWSPLVTRQPLRWPNGARVALCVIVSLEHIEWTPPKSAVVPPSVSRVGAYPTIFDVHDISHHEYGNRVGFFRVAEVLDRHALRATAAIDSMLTLGNPFIVEQCRRREWEFIGHGVSMSRMITEQMSEAEERDYLTRSLDAVRSATGTVPRGWLGPEYGESTRTVRLLAELGVEYVCDWPNDEQPYRMTVPQGTMIALPVTFDGDDVITLRERSIPVQGWARIVQEAFDRLYEDGAETGRLLVLNLHPYLIGQPFRIKYLDEALRHVLGHDAVWAATGSEIVDWYAQLDQQADGQ